MNSMRIQLTFLIIVIFQCSIIGQDIGMNLSYQFVDSVLSKIYKEKEPRKRLVYGMSMIRSGIEAEPLYMLEVGKKLYDIAKRIDDPVTESVAWSFYGQGYRLTGNYVKALESHNKAIQIAETVTDKSLIAYAYNQLGHIYKDRDDTSKALSLYWNSKYFAELGKNYLVQGYACMNLGAVYLNANLFDSSLYYSQKAYEILQLEDEVATLIKTQMSSTLTVSDIDMYILTNIASAYSKQKKFLEAEQYYSKAKMALQKNVINKRYLHILLYNQAQHFERKNILDSFLYYAKLSIKTIENTSFSYLSAKPAKLLSDYYEIVNPDSTVKYLKLYLKTNEIINSTRVTQQLQMMSFEEQQRREEIKQAEIIYRNKIQFLLLVVGLGIAGLFVGMMYRNNRIKQKANNELKQKTKKLEDALTRLSSTQSQLIQSEKMASLGELTAGIAHEIQNPLNFINNFSEVNQDLLAELKTAVEKGDWDEVKLLAADVQANEDKITHHGKRADAIVKGMLQHSRHSTGQKEATDINALCDEYLRLAYHGLRASDKGFNAQLSTSLDPAVGVVSVMVQELGRVILNLINNAFYAVHERKQKEGAGFTPEVTITTQRVADQIMIKVADNGGGIPAAVKEKIFQPFFTTKPTGKGTGLGLSLSYDIITKGHQGKIELETAEGVGTTFTIILPVK